MKTKAYIIIGSIFIWGIVSCVRDNNDILVDQRCARLIAHMDLQSDTKTVLEKSEDGRYYPLWETSDSLAVFTEPGQSPTAFKLIDGEGTGEGLFEGPLSGERYVAVSPYNAQAKWTDNQLELVLPERQSRINPMVAISENGDLHFKNLCSIIKLSLTGSCVVGSIKLHSDNHCLSGPASVNLSYTDSPILVMKEGGSHDVQMECGAVLLNKEVASEFFIFLPPGSYEDLTICIDTYTKSITKSISQEVVLSRSELRPVSSFLVEAPMIDLDNLPNNQVWYKTRSGKIYSPKQWESSPPFNARIVSNAYFGEYGIIITDVPITTLNGGSFSIQVDEIIEELHIPDCVESISTWALPSLKSFRVPGKLKSCGSDNWSRVDSIYGPLVTQDGHSIVSDGVLLGVVIGDLDEYSTPPEVHTIRECGIWIPNTNMRCVTISEGVRVIESSALSFTSESLVLPESIEIIGNQNIDVHGFYGSSHCTSSDHVCLINPRTNYGKQIVCIASDRDNESYSLPEGVSWMSTPFKNWPNLKSVIIPESMARIHTPLFVNCPNIERLEGPRVSDDGRCFVSDGSLYLYVDRGEIEYTLPTGVKHIVEGALSLRESRIEKLVLNEGVTHLDFGCFENAPFLKTVIFPTTISDVESLVFNNDEKLESVYLPVKVPPSVKGAPSDYPLPNLKVYVPEESYDAYLSDPVWGSTWKQYLEPYHYDWIDYPVPYESSDYSQDGKVVVLQSASEGKGIDIVFMGDGFTDRHIADGTYLSVMEEAMVSFFEIEPYKSFRHLFNAYAVNIVSQFEGSYSYYIEDVRNLALDYTTKAIPDERMDEVTVAIIHKDPFLMNAYSGLCSFWIRSSTPVTDYGSGMGIAMIQTTEMRSLIKHEMGGHGFGKLDDEYTGHGLTIPESFVEIKREDQERGYWKNIDFTSDVAKVRWSKFLADPRYEKERLGIYEGGSTDYSYGVYRPSERSIMVDNQGGFNAPSREAIYYRIHKLAYGPEWEYNYEDFVKWDQGAKNIHPTATPQSVSGKKTYEVREPLPSKPFNPDEWTVTVMK